MGNLLSVDEVAKRLQVSRKTVYQLIHEGLLPTLRPSRQVIRIPEEALKKVMGIGQPELTDLKSNDQHDGLVVVTVGQLTRIIETAVRKAVKEAMASASTGDGDGRGLLTADEVARRMGVKRKTVLRWVREGRLPAIRFSSRKIRIPESALKGALFDGRGTAEMGANEQH